jgi:uncharacterized protein with von Willebrand factor type A (vWA) domain
MSLAVNVVHFARLLRAAGVPIGTDRILLALQALQATGIGSRADFHAALSACLIDRAEHRLLFDRAFDAFWQALEMLDQRPRQSLPPVAAKRRAKSQPAERRLTEALFERPAQMPTAAGPLMDFRAELSWSDRERLRKADFEAMSAAEWLQAQRLASELATHFPHLPTRRFVPSMRGERIDLHELLREAARHGGDIATLPRRRRKAQPPPLVALVDISGSMSRYSRVFLHFLYALAGSAQRANCRLDAFVFGTRLTRITRRLRGRDPDLALAGVIEAVDDWSGGTRIAACLREFNIVWVRRVLPGNATLLLVTDGLERAETELLTSQMERLSKSCRHLIWLNPLLRYTDFEPKARGVRAMLPFVDRLMPVHNLESLEALGAALAASFRNQSRGMPLRPSPLPRVASWS